MLDPGTPTPELQLDKRLSEVLMQYYRLTSTTAGRARASRFEIFVNYYGGNVKAGRITKRSQLEKRLYASIFKYGVLFLGQKVLKTYRGTYPKGCTGAPPSKGRPGRTVTIGNLLRDFATASDRMAKGFATWLEKKL